MRRKIISLILCFSFLFTQSGFAQGVAELNLGQYLGQMSHNLSVDKFRPLHLRYLSYDLTTDNFQLLLDKGDNPDIKDPELEDQTKVLMEYFQIGLALPNDKFWVNLRPDAQDQLIDPELEKTDLGKVMLEADLQLKRDTANWTSPQTPEGRLYWDKLYSEYLLTVPDNIPNFDMENSAIDLQIRPNFNFLAFFSIVQLALYDLKTKTNGFTNKPITHSFANIDPGELITLQLRVSIIAKAIGLTQQKTDGTDIKEGTVLSALKPGGIDFRTMQMLIQPMGSFSNFNLSLPTLSSSALERIDLDKELASLRKMASSGIAPSGQRVKEYLAACFQKGRFEEKQDDLLLCLAEIYRLEEEEVSETSPELNESLVIADTGRFVLLPTINKAGLN